MRIDCLHGFFEFRPDSPSEVSMFNSIFGYDLAKRQDHFTFEKLADAETYCLEGKPYTGATPTKTLAGHPSEIFKANGFVFNFSKMETVPKISVNVKVQNKTSNFRRFQSGLIIPGSLSDEGRIVSYSCSTADGWLYLYDWIDYDS